MQWLRGDRSFDRLIMVITNPDSYFWFLWVLFWICCIFTFCQWIADKLKIDKIIPAVISCLLLMGVMVGLDFRMFGFQFLAYYFLFYTLGYCIHRFPPIFKIKTKILLTLLFLLWCILAWYWNMHALPYWMPEISIIPSSLLQYIYRGITAFIAVIFIFAMAPKVLNESNRFNTLVKTMGEVSLGLYVCHLTIMGDIVKGLRYILPNLNNTTIIVFAFIIGCAISLLIVQLLAKNVATAKFLLGKV